MHRMRLLVAIVCALLCVGDAALGQFGRPQQQRRTAEDLVSVQVLVDTAEIQPGENFHLVVLFEINPTWHIYWKNPGDGAAATSVELELPDGFERAEARWPRPKRTESAFGDVFAHTGEAAIFFPITAPEEIDVDAAIFSARIAFAVCDDRMCLFGDLSRELTVPISINTPSRHESFARADTITRHYENLPRPITATDSGRAEFREKPSQLVIVGPVQKTATDTDRIAFYPFASPGVVYDVAGIEVENGQFTATIDLDIQPRNFINGPPDIGGLIVFDDEPDGPSYEVKLPLPSEAVLKH